MSSHPGYWGNRYTTSAAAYSAGLRAERTFHPGQQVRFIPPDGAYSPTSAQRAAAGKAGVVVTAWSDSYALVMFGGGSTLMVNSDYLEENHV